MINRYDTPAQAQFINTYVPMPFEQMYTMGKQAKDDVDAALNTLSTTFDKWSEFHSPSQVDTESWYNETIGKAMPTVKKLSSNLDYLKSAAGRAELFSTLNNLDYRKLGNLKQSRDAMLAGQEYRARLAAAGKYNPDWHDVDFANYDTLRNDIFGDISPLAYTSIQELADPYVKNLKDSHLESDGMWDYYGVSGEQISTILDQNMSGIMNTPEAQMHIQTMMRNQGLTRSEAETAFRNKAVVDSLQYTRINREENRFALESYKADMALRNAMLKPGKGSGSGSDNDPGTLIDMIKRDGQVSMMERVYNTPDMFPHAASVYSQLTPDMTEEQVRGVMSNLGKAVTADLQLQFSAATGIKPTDVNKINDYAQLRAGIETVLSSMVSNIDASGTDSVVGAGGQPVQNEDGTTSYMLNTSKGMLLPSSFALNAIGTQGNKNSKVFGKITGFEDDLKNGKFRNIKVKGTGETYTYYSNGQQKSATRVIAEIPTSELKRNGYNGNWWKNSPLDQVYDRLEGEGASIKRGGAWFNKPYLNFDASDDTVTVELIQEIPDRGQMNHRINQHYLGKDTSSTYSSNAYQGIQAKAYDDSLNY